MGLTGVQRSEGSSVIEGATIGAQTVLQVIVVERIRRRNHYVARVVAGPTLLYWAAVGGAGPTGPAQRRLQRRVLRVVLRHAPQLRAHDAGLGLGNRRAGGEEWEREDQEEKDVKSFFHCCCFLGYLREKGNVGVWSVRGSEGFMGEEVMKSNRYSEFGDGERGNGGIKERKKINKEECLKTDKTSGSVD